ncbi:MAG TPA: hypothetical protein VHQ65_06200 [Thermoanaerobaculia bacterium]|nr:hypothetical protein [Thermoanaerobaculia bacterium]
MPRSAAGSAANQSAAPVPGDDARLEERVLSGADRELAHLAARGLLPLPLERTVPLQVSLARGADRELAAEARLALATFDARRLAPYVARLAAPDVLAFFAAENHDPVVLEALIRRRDVPRRLLVELAPRLPPPLQEVLVLRQDAMVDEPAIADALESNPDLAPEVRRRLGEYRRHLLRAAGAAEPVPAPAAPGPPGGEAGPGEATGEPSDAVVAVALEQAAAAPAGEGEREGTTGLTEIQVRMLPVPVRMRLARGASRALRNILLRDTNYAVARTVLDSNTFSEQEMESLAANRSLDDKVLGEIGKRREWVGKYRVMQALASNPRTPLAVSVKLVARLSVRDLRLLSFDRNVPEAVRAMAKRLYRIKRQ